MNLLNCFLSCTDPPTSLRVTSRSRRANACCSPSERPAPPLLAAGNEGIPWHQNKQRSMDQINRHGTKLQKNSKKNLKKKISTLIDFRHSFFVGDALSFNSNKFYSEQNKKKRKNVLYIKKNVTFFFQCCCQTSWSTRWQWQTIQSWIAFFFGFLSKVLKIIAQSNSQLLLVNQL